MQVKFSNIRTSELVLDRVLNPTNDKVIGAASGDDIVEACGLIPDFFCQACLNLEKFNDSDLQNVADGMDTIYGFGGFQYPWDGTLTDDGIYQSNDGDPDMSPLALFSYHHMQLFVYQYGICAIRDSEINKYKVARFD